MKKAWEIKKLGEVYDVRDGTHDSPKYIENGFPLITSKNLKEGVITYDKVKFISENDYVNINKRSKVDKGDVLFAMIGTIGNPVEIVDEPNYAIKNVALFKVDKNQNSRFLKYYLNSSFVINKMNKDAKGTTQKFVGLGYLRSFQIPIPPLPEQKRIVNILDKAFAEIAQAKANAEQNLKNAKELFESYLNGIFENKGDDWEEKEWNELIEIRSGRNQKQVIDINGEYPIYGSAGKIMGFANSYICEEGTTIIGRKGTIDKPIYFDTKFWNVDTAFGLIAGELIDKLFLFYFCKNFDFYELNKGTTLPSLVKKDLIKIKMPYPPIKKQKQIVKKLDQLQVETKKLELVYQQKLDNLEELKKSILQKAFNGEL